MVAVDVAAEYDGVVDHEMRCHAWADVVVAAVVGAADGDVD